MAMASRVLGRALCSAASRYYPRSISAAPFIAAKDLAASLTASATRSRSFAKSALDVKPAKSGDSGLLKVLKAEIEHEQETEEVVSLKPPSPFTLDSKPGSQDVILRRAFNSEDIAITCVFRLSDYDEPISGEEDDDEAEEPVSQEEVDMTITVSKGGDEPVLEISCTCTQGSIEIDKVSYIESKPGKDSDSIPYGGPDFSELDEDLQKQFKKYLDARGINDELANFLVNYMPEKERQEYLRWLKNVDKFVRK